MLVLHASILVGLGLHLDRVPLCALGVLGGYLGNVGGEVADVVFRLDPLLLWEGAAHEVLLECNAETVGAVVALLLWEAVDGLRSVRFVGMGSEGMSKGKGSQRRSGNMSD